MQNKLGTQNITRIILFGIGLAIKGSEALEDGKITLAEGIDTTMYVGSKLPATLRSSKQALAEFKELSIEELAAIANRVKSEILLDGNSITEQRAVAIVGSAFDVATSVYALVESLKGEINETHTVDDLYESLKRTEWVEAEAQTT